MHYQTLVDLVIASPSQPQMAAKSGLLLSAAAQALGRKPAPELAGIVPTAVRPNAEQMMSGEYHAGGLAGRAQPQFHLLDPVVSRSLQAVAHGLVPAVAWHAAKAARPPARRAAAFPPSMPAGLHPALLAALRRRSAPTPARDPFSAAAPSPGLDALVPGAIVAD